MKKLIVRKIGARKGIRERFDKFYVLCFSHQGKIHYQSSQRHDSFLPDISKAAFFETAEKAIQKRIDDRAQAKLDPFLSVNNERRIWVQEILISHIERNGEILS